MKRTKKQIPYIAVGIVLLAILIYSLFPKTTVASILRLDSKDQIVKVEIGSALEPYEGRFLLDNEREWKDITDTPLGDRYRDALFSTRAVRKDIVRYSYGEDEVAAVRITLGNLPENYPYSATEYILYVGLPPESTTPISLRYTVEEQKRLQEKLNAEGKGEVAPRKEEFEFALPDSELFTVDFINKQFE